MKKEKRATYRKIEYHRKESIYLIIRGVEVGVAAGLICVLYRYALSLAEGCLMSLLERLRGKPFYIVLWLVLLAVIGFVVHLIIKAVPMARGSGIPQINGEIKGELEGAWCKVLPAKLFGGTLSVLCGLSLGREGPSVQLGGMAAKGVAELTRADKTTQLRMISCGAGAGMSAAFNAPLSAIMFVLEEIHRTFDKSILCMGIVASITADFISKLFFGQSTTFHYDTVNFPLRYCWLLVLIGIVCAIAGSAYNALMLKAQEHCARRYIIF